MHHWDILDLIFITFGRVGYCARGFVWSCIGGVAISGAFTGDKTEGPNGAIGVVTSTRDGWIVLIPLVIGIFCYSLWRLFEGFYGVRTQLSKKSLEKSVGWICDPFLFGNLLFHIGDWCYLYYS